MKILLDEMYTGMKDYLEAMGWEVETVNEAGMQGASDKKVIEYAGENSLIIVTQDEKLADIAELTEVKCVLISKKMIARLIDSQTKKSYGESKAHTRKA